MNTKLNTSRLDSREGSPHRQSLSRRLSREETFHLADTAFRKSSMREIREDLRLRLGHTQMLELLLHEIALSDNEYSPPSSPPLLATSPASPSSLSSSSSSSSSKSSHSSSRKTEHKIASSGNLGTEYAIIAPSQPTNYWGEELPRRSDSAPKSSTPSVDEYGFAYDDYEEEDDDLTGLSLCRTSSHRPSR